MTFTTRRRAAIQQQTAAGFHIERFERVERLLRVPDGAAALRLLARVPARLPDGDQPSLIVRHAAFEHEFKPLGAYSGCVPASGGRDWMLGSVFAPSAELADEPGAVFALRLSGGAVLALPAPGQRARGTAQQRPWPYVVRRAPALVVATCQAFVLASTFTAGALADGTASTPSANVVQGADNGTTGPTGPSGPTGPQGGNGGQGSQPPDGGAGPTPPAVNPPDGSGGQQPSGGDAGQGGSPTPGSGQGQGTGSDAAPGSHPPGLPSPATKGVPTSVTPGGAASPDHRHGNNRGGKHGNRKARKHASKARHHAPNGGLVVPPGAAGTAAPLGAPLNLSGLLPNPSWLMSSDSSVALVANRPPTYLIPIYQHAGHRYGVPWRVLAAINALETNYGHDLNVSSAGAEGWMQFMPGTWRRWGLDANGDGSASPYDPVDAIYSAARYLHANSYRGRYDGRARWSIRHAIYAYNHAHWYVEAVLLGTQLLGGGGHVTGARADGGVALPLDPWYMNALGRTDDGLDIETAPDGALVYSMTTGVVTAVASNPSGFGPNYPVVETTKGPLKGRTIYYGHVARSLVKRGEKVYAGQPIAIIGHTGDALSLGHGHVEVGFSDPGGDPLNHHGPVAWTASGQGMRAVIVRLSSRFGIHNS